MTRDIRSILTGAPDVRTVSRQDAQLRELMQTVLVLDLRLAALIRAIERIPFFGARFLARYEELFREAADEHNARVAAKGKP